MSKPWSTVHTLLVISHISWQDAVTTGGTVRKVLLRELVVTLRNSTKVMNIDNGWHKGVRECPGPSITTNIATSYTVILVFQINLQKFHEALASPLGRKSPYIPMCRKNSLKIPYQWFLGHTNKIKWRHHICPQSRLSPNLASIIIYLWNLFSIIFSRILLSMREYMWFKPC